MIHGTEKPQTMSAAFFVSKWKSKATYLRFIFTQMQPLDNCSVYTSMRIIKTIIFALIAILSSLSAIAQNEDNAISYSDNNEYKSLFSLDNIRGYASIHGGAMNVEGNDLIANTGGSVAAIFNHKLAVGFTGTGFVGFQNTTINGEKHSMAGGYGGLLIEPIFFSKKAVHFTFPISMGAGQNQYFKDSLGYEGWENLYRDEFVQDFVYIQPGVNVELNLTKFMRFGVSASYMLSNTINTTPINKTQLDGLTVGANLKLGWFK